MLVLGKIAFFFIIFPRKWLLVEIRSKVIVSKELFEKAVMWTEAFGFLRYGQNLDGAKFAEQELYDGWIHYV